MTGSDTPTTTPGASLGGGMCVVEMGFKPQTGSYSSSVDQVMSSLGRERRVESVGGNGAGG